MLTVKWKRTVAALSVGLVLTAALPGPTAAATGPGHRGGAMYGVAAQAIGITPEQLRQQLPGKSLAQVATDHGKNPADVATALKTAANARIDQAMNQVVPVRTATAAPTSGAPAPTGT